MTRSATYALRLPVSLKENLTQVAENEGISINQFITLAVAEKLAVMETARFFSERAGRADMDAFRRILNREGGEPPRLGDEMPEDKEFGENP
ncbi:MAG: toxin-antitoxin system HicB family antitoxin [Caldilineaceae bacterium]|nr:toxin-antitoxin system HicB family antitoxin [Caldilineaceae bacterium]